MRSFMTSGGSYVFIIYIHETHKSIRSFLVPLKYSAKAATLTCGLCCIPLALFLFNSFMLCLIFSDLPDGRPGYEKNFLFTSPSLRLLSLRPSSDEVSFAFSAWSSESRSPIAADLDLLWTGTECLVI